MKVRKAHLPALSLLRHELEVSHGAWPAPQSLNLWSISSTLMILWRKRTVQWSTEGATHRGPRWDTTLLSYKMLLMLWVTEHSDGSSALPMVRTYRLESAEAKGTAPLTATPTNPRRHLLPPPRFWSLLFGALGSQGRFVSTREDNSGPKKTEIETICSFYH